MIYLSFVWGQYFNILLIVFLLLFGDGTVFILQYYSAIFNYLNTDINFNKWIIFILFYHIVILSYRVWGSHISSFRFNFLAYLSLFCDTFDFPYFIFYGRVVWKFIACDDVWLYTIIILVFNLHRQYY